MSDLGISAVDGKRLTYPVRSMQYLLYPENVDYDVTQDLVDDDGQPLNEDVINDMKKTNWIESFKLILHVIVEVNETRLGSFALECIVNGFDSHVYFGEFPVDIQFIDGDKSYLHVTESHWQELDDVIDNYLFGCNKDPNRYQSTPYLIEIGRESKLTSTCLPTPI